MSANAIFEILSSQETDRMVISLTDLSNLKMVRRTFNRDDFDLEAHAMNRLSLVWARLRSRIDPIDQEMVMLMMKVCVRQ
jgi:hypothetical protein